MAALGAFVSRVAGIDDPSAQIVERLAATMPADARSVLTDQLDAVLGEQQAGLLSVGILGAMWAAAGGMSALMRAMNIAYDVPETRPWWSRLGIALGLTLLAGALLIVAFTLAVAGAALISALADAAGLGDGITTALAVLRWVAVAVLLLVATAFLFAVTPDAHLPIRWITPGATAFILAWLLTTIGLGWYVSKFASYNATYGTLGGVVILLLWSYLTAYVLLAGAELNALLARLNGERLAQRGDEVAAMPRASEVGRGAQAGAEAPGSRRPTPRPAAVSPKTLAARRGLGAQAAGALIAFVALTRVIPRLARGER